MSNSSEWSNWECSYKMAGVFVYIGSKEPDYRRYKLPTINWNRNFPVIQTPYSYKIPVINIEKNSIRFYCLKFVLFLFFWHRSFSMLFLISLFIAWTVFYCVDEGRMIVWNVYMLLKFFQCYIIVFLFKLCEFKVLVSILLLICLSKLEEIFL